MPDAPRLLYHYTDARGLLGIIETRTLWATDAEFLNDAQELRYGRAELQQALTASADELDPTRGGGVDPTDLADYSRATVMRSALAHLDEPGGMFLSERAHSVHVACFCEESDLLSQWRAYGVSGGFAIGFRTPALAAAGPLPLTPSARKHWEEIRDVPGVEPDTAELVQVEYGETARANMVETVLAEIAPQPTGHPGVTGFHRAKTVVLPALARVKHPAFGEEREWRLIVIASVGIHAVRFRAGSLGVAPYLELPLHPTAITEIVVGPGENPEVRRLGVERLLAEHQLRDVGIRYSEAPFRG